MVAETSKHKKKSLETELQADPIYGYSRNKKETNFGDEGEEEGTLLLQNS
jgi:hypothetical protein